MWAARAMRVMIECDDFFSFFIDAIARYADTLIFDMPLSLIPDIVDIDIFAIIYRLHASATARASCVLLLYYYYFDGFFDISLLTLRCRRAASCLHLPLLLPLIAAVYADYAAAKIWHERFRV